MSSISLFSVGSDQRPSRPETASSWEDTMRLTRFPEVVNATISQEWIAKNASGVTMRMNKP